MDNYGASEFVIQESGCGAFQVIIVLLVYMLLRNATASTMMFMSYGIYNPGWRCLDQSVNASTNINSWGVMEMNFNNATMKMNRDNINVSKDYTQGTCSFYKACRHVEFDPKTSTVVTEWGLICDKDWIASLIISLQMTGLLIGFLVAGQLGDTFGRKKVLYVSLILTGAVNLGSAFSPNWQVFAALRFLVGFVMSAVLNLMTLIPSEFINSKWRGRMPAIFSWHIGGILFALMAMWCEDWKVLHIVTAIVCIVGCLPAFWVPESLRWLEINHKHKQFEKVVQKMNMINKKAINADEFLKQKNELQESLPEKTKQEKKCTMRDIFCRGYRLKSFIIGIVFMFSGLSFFAISFGMKAMFGNIYVNLICMFAADIAFSIVPMYLPNAIGRRNSSLFFVLLGSLSMLAISALEIWTVGGVRKFGTLILAILAKACSHSAWYVLLVLVAEIYPTCARSIASGYVNMTARIGAVLAPLFIPTNPDTVSVSYFAMGVIGLLCCLSFIKLPETRETKMMETFDEDEQC